MAKKLIDSKDIMKDLISTVTPKYFPENTLDKNRVSIYGYLTEAMANSIEDTVTLEQRRAADYCPELSNNEIHVHQTAKLRNVNVMRSVPGKAFAIIGVLKKDILERGTKLPNETVFTIDRRSSIIHDGINFSLEDDIVIRAVKRSGKYVYAASYSGVYATHESYIQMYEQTDDLGQDLISMIVQIYQFNYNIQEKVVTDEVGFLYDGIGFDYDNKLADFEIYYRRSYEDSYKRLEKAHYLTTELTPLIYYNDDDSGIIYVLNNPALNIGTNAMIKVEIKETLGKDGMVTIGDGNTTMSLYRDGSYNYTGVNIYVNMLSDTAGATDGDSLSDIKARLIDAKTRRDNITTEHDIISYINDIDANVQIIKKRNDIQDRKYYMYTLLRRDKEIVPATTKRLVLKGITNSSNIGDFDIYDVTVDRKLIHAYNKFKLVQHGENEYAVKVPVDEPEDPDGFYYTCPFMMLVNDKNITSYYYTSVNDDVTLNMKPLTNTFPFQIITRSVMIHRNAHDVDNANKYTVTVTGTMNTSNDEALVDTSGQIIDKTAINCYIIFRTDNTPSSYMKMNIDSYNRETREFTFVGELITNDYITEQDRLEITKGLYRNGTDRWFNSVIDYRDASLDVYFTYKTDNYANYPRTDEFYKMIPSTFADGYVLMCSYYNTPHNDYNLILEFNKFTSSPTKIEFTKDKRSYYYSIGEVPFIQYQYGIDHINEMYDSFKKLMDTYGNLLKLTTDFDVSLKFISTYGRSKYIDVHGGLDPDGNEIIAPLNNLNPTFYFKVYGYNINVAEVKEFIYEYLRDTYITNNVIFMSNICTLVEQNFNRVNSIKYMGVDKFDGSYQQFVYDIPKFDNVDVITKFVPEQLNVSDIIIDLDEK